MRKILRWFLLRLAPGRLGAAHLAALVTEAELALAAGVAPTLAEWRRLSGPERTAWVLAFERHGALDAVRAALAAGHAEAAAELAAPIDGGALRRQLADARLRAQVDAAAATLARRRPPVAEAAS